jgi:probable DNA repair protein
MRLACPGLFSWFEKKAIIVTPSPLLAAVATQQAAAYHLEKGRESFERAPIYSIDAWLTARWQEARYAADVPLLLSPSQERALWQTIIEQEQPGLFDPSAAAGLARRAATLLAQWHIPSEGDLWRDHEDGRQFQMWLQLFRGRCQREGWITRADLWRMVPAWITAGVCSRELTVFAAFEETTPALERVKHSLGSAAFIEPARLKQSPGRARVKSFSSFREELEYAARVARAALERDPKQSIAVFVPGLSAQRPLVERIFEQVLYPTRSMRFAPTHVAGAEHYSAFHITASTPLGEHPIAANALLLAELARPRIHHAEAAAILRSPFLSGAAAERSARAMADLDLRRRRELDVTMRELEAASSACPLLTPVWSAVRRVLRKRPKQAELPVWSEFIRDLLQAAGWPGDMPLTAEEQKAVEQWNETLSSLAALGLVSNRLTYDAALAHLRRLLSRAGLEHGDWFSPVQILDAEDCSALAFDSAIITGLSDETWPPAIEPSPLVPFRLQRAHDVPATSPESILETRQRLTGNLFQSASQSVITYSGHLSPIAGKFVDTQEIDTPKVDIPVWLGKMPRQSFAPAALDERDDTNAPPYMAREIARGGTGLIKAQSLCPFRAFAEYRLEAKAPEDACFGFDARDRGGFVHRALQLIWQELGDQNQLRSTPDDHLRAIVQDAVSQAVADDASSPLHRLTSSAERERLERLLLDWLRLERTRKQPFTVETVEQERYYEIPGLRLKLRVDRIDRLKNGKVLLIDYKSGKQSRKKLECPRPHEPQLLVYAAATGEDVDGVFFGELKPRELRVVGFSREKHFDSPSVTVMRDGWDAFLRRSEDEVERIAGEFVRGHAAVDPLRGACEYCGIRPLCRVNESPAPELEEE